MRSPGASALGQVATAAKLPVTVLPLDVDDDASVAEVFAKVGESVAWSFEVEAAKQNILVPIAQFAGATLIRT